MKDIIDNRSHLTVSGKLRIAFLALRENGIWWMTLLGIYWIASALAERSFAALNNLRNRRGNPGLNSLAANKAIWSAWDWQTGGEEWTPSLQWKEAVTKGVMRRFVPDSGVVLEIGPGAGRWTEQLLDRCKAYYGVDISNAAIEVCRQRFALHPNATFFVGSGDNLKEIANNSVDAIWSFDVFVHINEREVSSYVDEFLRVMKADAVGVVHHGGVGGAQGGWRSNLSHAAMLHLLSERGLEVIDSFRKWSVDGEEHQLDTYADVITVFRKPSECRHSFAQ